MTLEKEKMYLNKLNMILVQVRYEHFLKSWNQYAFINILNSIQVLKREWPKNWESFIPDIVGASKTNESLCQNNMIILKLLSEEVFDFSTGQMTQTKTKHLKDTMCSEFSQIFQLCQFVLVSGRVCLRTNNSLVCHITYLLFFFFLGEFRERRSSRGNIGNLVKIPQLDTTRLYFRNWTYSFINNQVFECPNVQKRYIEMSHRNRRSYGDKLRRNVYYFIYSNNDDSWRSTIFLRNFSFNLPSQLMLNFSFIDVTFAF